MVGSLLITGQSWLWPAIAVLVIGLLLVWFGYRRTALPPGIRTACILLKLTGILALALCFLEPQWTSPRVVPGANTLLLLADNSLGMQIRDEQTGESQASQIQHALTNEAAPWLSAVARDFKIRRYLFDHRVQGTTGFQQLSFEGTASSLHTALNTLAERFRDQPLAGIVLFSDGNATDSPEGLDTAGWPPVYPVTVASESSVRDIGIDQVSVRQTAFEDSPVTIEATVNVLGRPGLSVEARLLNSAGEQVETQTQRLPARKDSLVFRFHCRPENPGTALYTLQVCAAGEPDPWLTEDPEGEATVLNNQRLVTVNREGGPYRLLYFSGRPNWEFKFLNRALEDDPEMELAWLIRIAKREPRFEFRGRAGESSNPLYRGFDRQNDDTERYDQPVFRYASPWNDTGLAQGFPKTEEEIFEYHGLILDDIEADALNLDQMNLIQRFVSHRGGGFLMLGGAESFSAGDYPRTPIAELLPVYLDRIAEGVPPTSLKLSLTREGWLEPWTRIRQGESDEEQRLASLPPYAVLNVTRQIKPGASLLATVQDERQRTFPALAVHRFGMGRAGALLLGDLWHSGLPSEMHQHELLQTWRQMIRWLVTDTPQRVELVLNPHPAQGLSAQRIQVRVRDEKYVPMDNAHIDVGVTFISNRVDSALSDAPLPDDTAALRLTLEPSLEEAGLYETTFVGRQDGVYVAKASVTDAAGKMAGKAEKGWASNPNADELRSLKPNHSLLRQIATRTGGEVIPISALDQLAERLPNLKAPITETATRPLWHLPAVFLFALACFLTEWGLRRWKGLP